MHLKSLRVPSPRCGSAAEFQKRGWGLCWTINNGEKKNEKYGKPGQNPSCSVLMREMGQGDPQWGSWISRAVLHFGCWTSKKDGKKFREEQEGWRSLEKLTCEKSLIKLGLFNLGKRGRVIVFQDVKGCCGEKHDQLFSRSTGGRTRNNQLNLQPKKKNVG